MTSKLPEGDQPLPQEQENALVSLLLNIVIPAVILSALSKEGRLGPVWALVFAAGIPAAYGIWFAFSRRQANIYSILGVVSVLLTGILGLFKTDPLWFAVKEALMPLIIAAVILLSHLRPNPFVASILLNPQMVDRPKITAALTARDALGAFRDLLWKASLALSVTLVASSVANFFLARYFLHGKEGGSEEYVKALGTITWVGYVVIGLPMMVGMIVILMKFMKGVSRLTGLSTDDFLVGGKERNSEPAEADTGSAGD